MHSLRTRLVVALVSVVLVAALGFIAIVGATSRPAVISTYRGFLALQADEAARTWEREGRDALAAYLERAGRAIGADYTLVDGASRDVATGDDITDRVEMARAKRRAAWSTWPPWEIIIEQPARDGRHRLVVVRRWPIDAAAVLPYLALVLGAVGLLAAWLVHDIVRPIGALAGVVERFGRGQYDTRVAIGRRDEIGRLGRAFNEMASRIERQVVAERRLLQDISHELRSPLTRLNIGIELLRSASGSGDGIDQLQRDADRLSDLVGTLLDVARLEGDPAQQLRDPVAVFDLVETSVADLGVEAEANGTRIELDGAGACVVPGSAELLRRAFDNVLSNAVRYAPVGTAVQVQYHERPAEISVVIRDRGPGVPDAALPMLGTAFYRVDESRSAATGGAGLGLAIACRAVHQHRGTVTIANADPGLSVTITLPLSAS